VSAVDFPDALDRGARYHVHYWLKALSSAHDVDFLLVESYSHRHVHAPELTTAKVINLSEPPSRALLSRMMRVARSVISGIPRSAQIAMPQAAVEYVREAAKERRYDLAILWVGSAAGYATILQGACPSFLASYRWTPLTLGTRGSDTACGIPCGSLMSGSHGATNPEPAVPLRPYPR
jgi:hypothetical protein